jgi:LPXTG-motif cell wall-anchored protein
MVLAHDPTWAAATTPSVTLTPGTGLASGQTVTVSVGPNSTFSPGARVVILECADPGGTPATLPTSDSTCDGNTVQPDTLQVGSDGSITEASYTIYALPSRILGEQSNVLPACNLSNACVLYIGQNQNDFTAPKVFSAPFSVAPAATDSTGVSTTTTSSPNVASDPSSGSAESSSTATPAVAGAHTSAVGASTVDGISQLPNTGLPDGALALALLGIVLLVSGSIGRRVALRRPA